MSVRVFSGLILVIAMAGCSRNEPALVPGTPLVVKGLSLELPPGWKSVPPTSSMRLAQAVIEGPGGPAEMAVFHFGAGQGGDIEANVQRWLGQVVPRPGTEPQRKVFDANGLRVTWVDAEGTLQASQMAAQPSAPLADARLLGAVVEGPGGPWFLKATGPDATLGPQRLAFLGLLQRARAVPESPS